MAMRLFGQLLYAIAFAKKKKKPRYNVLENLVMQPDTHVPLNPNKRKNDLHSNKLTARVFLKNSLTIWLSHPFSVFTQQRPGFFFDTIHARRSIPTHPTEVKCLRHP